MNLPHDNQRTVVFMRHGHAAEGDDDFSRPLTDVGQRAALEAGDQLRHLEPQVDLVLCSSARRAQHTAELVASVLNPSPAIHVLPSLYLAESATYLHAIGNWARAEHRCVLIVGHNPGLSALCNELSGHSVWLREGDYVVHRFPIQP